MSLAMAWRGARSSPKRVGGADMDAVLATASGIGERIRELIGERPLATLFKANTRRERQELLEADSNLPLAEVDLDDTSIETPSGASQQLQRVEVECINATPEALQPFVEQLRDAAQLEPVAQSKFRAGLDAAGLKPGGLLQPLGHTDPCNAALRRHPIRDAAPVLHRGARKGTAGARRIRDGGARNARCRAPPRRVVAPVYRLRPTLGHRLARLAAHAHQVAGRRA